MSNEKENAMTVEGLLEMARSQGLEVKEQTAYYKIEGEGKGKAIYVAKTKKGVTRIDIAGFQLEHDAVTQLTASEAKEQRLGAVRGQIEPPKLPDGADWVDAYRQALGHLDDPAEGFKARPRAETPAAGGDAPQS